MSLAAVTPELAQRSTARLAYQTALGALYQGDCLDLMAKLDDGSVDLIFADPPFNLGKMYGAHYDDVKAEAEYERQASGLHTPSRASPHLSTLRR
ncbi:MAG: hypothetical protein LBL55_03185 [Propionibacteriaceae bacterium]|jgi:16S rRNA G966 N2-methylase RsmD|nr:hypothetical protein [Propionibacteriaceae bacterium]